jgi:LAO/AO transport system kinase
VARKTRETMLVCEAAGYDVIIVETVGVGQSETAVASMVDFFLVLLLAGAGDELQGLKKGILELADALAINKADGDNLGPARKAAKVFELALHLLQPSSPRWTPPVLTCSAIEMKGIDTIWKTVCRHREVFSASHELEEKRRRQAVDWMWSLIDDGLKERFVRQPDIRKQLPRILRDVERGALAPTAASDKLLFLLDNKSHE